MTNKEDINFEICSESEVTYNFSITVESNSHADKSLRKLMENEK